VQLNVPDYWFIFQDDKLLLLQKENNKVEIMTAPFFTQIKPFLIRHHYLGPFNQINCYCGELDDQAQLPPDISKNIVQVPILHQVLMV
jgi:hypothetical protein